MSILHTMYGGAAGRSDPIETAFADMKRPTSDFSLEELRDVHNRVQQEVAESNANLMVGAAADEFRARHPEYNDTDANGRTVKYALAKLGYTKQTVTIAAFEQAYTELLAEGLLDIDQKKYEEQQREAARARARDEHGRFTAENISEDAMYELDLNTIRERADRQLARSR